MAKVRTTAKSKKKKTKKAGKRKIVAIGDLHGDYHKLVRHLTENNLVNEKDLKWKKAAGNIDLVLIGDYVDWRGEEQEGKISDWINGSKKILVLLKDISEQLKKLRDKNKKFQSCLHLILGNHDDMMLSSLKVFEVLKPDEMKNLFKDFLNLGDIRRVLQEKNLDDKSNMEVVLSFVNWFYQGGRETIASFGSLEDWKKEMEGHLGDFLNCNLKLAVKLDNVFFSHSISDDKEYWRPADTLNKEILELPEREARELKKAYIWGRKIWGYDYHTGFHTRPFTREDIEELAGILGVDKIVIGHTPLIGKEIKECFNGRVINLDFHGVPGSPAFIKEY